MANIKEEVLNELKSNIMPFWINRMATTDGKPLGRIDGQGNPDTSAPRSAVLCARTLWAFSAAYRVVGKPEYLAQATEAKRELIDRFIDKEYGGVYWSLNPDGTPCDPKKQMYAIGFSIYGLSEYVRATGEDAESLRWASKLFADMENHCFDPEGNGYIEALSRDWSPIADMRLSTKDRNDSRTMNTHLHIIEPYTNLYRVLPSDKLKERIVNLLNIFTNRIVRQDGHLGLFFNDDWESQSDGISFGHDIEASWLLWEAAEVVEPACSPDPTPLKDRLKPICLKIADAADEGLGPQGQLYYEDCPSDKDAHWWVQAESVVGNWNAWQLSGNDKYRDASVRCWEFIKSQIICPDGEWYWSRRADGTANTTDDRAGFWKCPYHNSRMCLEIIERSEKC